MSPDQQTDTDSTSRSESFRYGTLMLLVAVLAAATVLVIAGLQRMDSFSERQNALAKRAVESVSSEVALYLESQRHLAQLTARTYAVPLRALAESSRDDPLHTPGWKWVREAIPDTRYFTLSDAEGQILLPDINGNLGKGCRRDLRHFAEHKQPDEVFIHTSKGPLGRHVDIFSSYPDIGMAQILMVSLDIRGLQKVLDNAVPPDHHLLLLRGNKKVRVELKANTPGSPELTANWSGDPTLTELASTPIAGTRWRTVDYAREGLFEQELRSIVLSSVSTWSVLALAAFGLWVKMRTNERQRVAAESEVTAMNASLEQLVLARTEELSAARDDLEFRASHDPLTGLLNRTSFEFRADDILQAGGSGAMLMLQLHGLKQINAITGYEGGDKALECVAAILTEFSDDHTFVARLDATVFGLLCDAKNTDQAETDANHLLRVLRAEKAFELHGEVTLQFFGGLTSIHPEMESRHMLFASAEGACRRARLLGSENVHRVESDDSKLEEEHQLLEWARKLPEACETGGFVLYGQPIVYTKNHHTPTYEVLLRVVGKDGKHLPPAQVIQAAERYERTYVLDTWVVRKAAAWLAQSPDDVQLHINLSGLTLAHPKILNSIVEIKERFELDPERIWFEVTETAFVADASQTNRNMQVLRGMGFRFALDDFGAGMCSFSYLRRLPVDQIKIDGGIIQHLLDDPASLAMSEAIMHMAHAMGLSVTAEFVSNADLEKKVRAIGVDAMQGYHLGLPAQLPVATNTKQKASG